MGEIIQGQGGSYVADEEARLRALQTLKILDTPTDDGFERIVSVARQALGVPISYVSFIDRDRQWFKAIQGLDLTETSRRVAICAHTIVAAGPLVVEDLTRDPRFSHLPLATEHGIRFYAGHPIADRAGHRVGTLAVLDREPRTLDHRQLATLAGLAGWVSAELARSAEAYERLFADAPIPLWEEDLTGVEAILERLRREGVEDLAQHLERHPRLVDELLRSIRVVDANEEALVLLEATSIDQAQGMFDGAGHVTDDARQFMRRRALALWQEEGTADAKVSWRTLRGNPITCYVRWSVPRVGGRLEVARSLLAIVDLTPIVQAEQRREQAEERYRRLVERLSVGVGVARASDGKLLDANPALVRILGYPDLETLLGSTVETRYADSDERDELLDRLDREGVVNDYPVQARRYDGSLVWVRATLTAMRGADGEMASIYGVFVDDSERRQAAEETARLLFVLEHTSDLVTINRFDDGRLVYANAACRRLLGAGPDDDLSALDPMELYGEENWELFRAKILPVLLEEGQWEGEVDIVTPDGRVIPASQVMLAHRDHRGHITHVSTIARDLTAQKRVEAELRESRDRLEESLRSKDRFLASISHELRTPLTVVVGLAHELATSLPSLDPDEAMELAGHVYGQGAELADLVEDLLVAARAEGGVLELHPARVELGALATRLVSDLEGLLRGCRVQVSAGHVVAWADPLRVRQVLRNLVTNAVRYGGDEVEVEVWEAGEVASVAVRDDGDGIPAELVEKVFEPYGRVHAGRSTPGSVGLGLSISRTLARMMGGDVVYRRVGSWSEFELTLPLR